VKNHVGRNCDFTLSNLYRQVDAAFLKVTADTCRGIIKKIRENEDDFWKDDAELDHLENG
jgi:hypothetical protein